MKSLRLVLLCVASFSPFHLYAEAKIGEGAVIRITQQQYPKLFAEWGSQGIQRINNACPAGSQESCIFGRMRSNRTR